MEDHIPLRPDRSLLLGRQTSKWSSWDLVFHENNSKYLTATIFFHLARVPPGPKKIKKGITQSFK